MSRHGWDQLIYPDNDQVRLNYAIASTTNETTRIIDKHYATSRHRENYPLGTFSSDTSQGHFKIQSRRSVVGLIYDLENVLCRRLFPMHTITPEDSPSCAHAEANIPGEYPTDYSDPG